MAAGSAARSFPSLSGDVFRFTGRLAVAQQSDRLAPTHSLSLSPAATDLLTLQSEDYSGRSADRTVSLEIWAQPEDRERMSRESLKAAECRSSSETIRKKTQLRLQRESKTERLTLVLGSFRQF